MTDPRNENDMMEEYRKFGAGKGLPEFIQSQNIFYVAIVTVILCVLAIIVSITFATCFWILDKAL